MQRRLPVRVDVAGRSLRDLADNGRVQPLTRLGHRSEDTHAHTVPAASSTTRTRRLRDPYADTVERAICVMSLEPESGKSLVTLGLAEVLSQRVGRMGYFRPVVRAGGADPMIELMRRRYHLAQTEEESYRVTTDQTRSVGTPGELDALVAAIMSKFHALAADCDAVLVEGPTSPGPAPPSSST